MILDLTEAKKKIKEDWQLAFPQLTLYSKISLYKIVGCVIAGIELIKLPRTEEYRPHFVMYPLWKVGIKNCLDIPIILKQYYNQKGLQFSIPYEKHSMYFNEVLKNIEKQTPLSFDEDIPLKKIYALIDLYSLTRPLSAAPNSYLQAVLYQAKFEIALFISTQEAKKILEQINNKNWDVNHFKIFNVHVNEWLQTLDENSKRRDELLKQIQINKQDKKIKKLKSSTIIE